QLPQDKRSDWPEQREVRRYNIRLRQAVDDLMSQISMEVLSAALEHRLMHIETYAYLLHHLSTSQKDIPLAPPSAPSPPPDRTLIDIPAGMTTFSPRRGATARTLRIGCGN